MATCTPAPAAVAEAAGSTFNLGFKTLPMIFHSMPLGQFVGMLFFFLLFLALSFDTHSQLPKRDMRQNITPQIAEGKKLWEVNNCIGCHTLSGEGAYFAPELGNVVVRYGDEGVKAFIQSRPKDGIPGRRSMPQFNFTDEQLNAIVAFLKHVNSINDANWPPNDQG